MEVDAGHEDCHLTMKKGWDARLRPLVFIESCASQNVIPGPAAWAAEHHLGTYKKYKLSVPPQTYSMRHSGEGAQRALRQALV